MQIPPVSFKNSALARRHERTLLRRLTFSTTLHNRHILTINNFAECADLKEPPSTSIHKAGVKKNIRSEENGNGGMIDASQFFRTTAGQTSRGHSQCLLASKNGAAFRFASVGWLNVTTLISAAHRRLFIDLLYGTELMLVVAEFHYSTVYGLRMDVIGVTTLNYSAAILCWRQGRRLLALRPAMRLHEGIQD